MELRALLFGEGLFETILWRGRTTKLLRHHNRLKSSAEFFQIPCPDFDTFCQEIEKKTKGRKNLYVKFCLLSKGEALYYSYPGESEILVIVRDFVPDTNPKKLCLSSIKRHSANPVVYHKTMNYLPNILTKREALSKGFDDAIMLNERDEVTECSASNILIVKDGKLFTPAHECGLLMGTTMEILIEKMNVKEERLTIDDLYNASSVFITNSLIGALPVVQFENKTYSPTSELLNSINSIIEEENQF
ncbi:aminotransferase class IV [Thermodesulfovibrio yellowstonii]|uniref:Aminodeoxychorismate lyase n=1 Tax=Thermodesulfovibrio yellowstonii TaxID=28262 RepID=A0A9W6GBW1_9BACT|nr:aminotransferase class IV [Thermodesulfovibrio islandicus]GLI52314.1 aminodeoxychorismate lyase [Thermodesulfovibrio islandicus]